MVSIPESAATPARERSCLPEVIFEGMSQGRVKLLGGLPQEGWVQGSVHLQGKWPLERHTRSGRSEEHTSELQSPCNLVCRLLLEKKKKHIHAAVLLSYGVLQAHDPGPPGR